MEHTEDCNYWYDFGYRRGVFDRCNGKEKRDISGWLEPAACGYEDAFESNEVRI